MSIVLSGVCGEVLIECLLHTTSSHLMDILPHFALFCPFKTVDNSGDSKNGTENRHEYEMLTISKLIGYNN